jgi:hypothetical protein
MRRTGGFDEVMIVNPGPARGGHPGERNMRFHYYGDPYQMGYYGQPVEGDYGQAPEFAGYGQTPEFAGYGYGMAAPYYGQVEPGYSEYEPVGYFAEEAPYGYYGEDPYAEYEPVAGCGEMPEMVGYGAEGYDGSDGYDEFEPLAEEYPGVADYGEPEISGYVRDVPPPFNAGCPMPTNIAGINEDPADFAGFQRPLEVNASCRDFTAQPGRESAVPDTLRPLW